VAERASAGRKGRGATDSIMLMAMIAEKHEEKLWEGMRNRRSTRCGENTSEEYLRTTNS